MCTPLPVCRQQTLPSQKRCWTHTAANREVVSSVLQHAAAMKVSFDHTWIGGCIMNPSLRLVFSEPMYSHLCWQIRQVWTRGVECAPAATLRLKVASGWSTSLSLYFAVFVICISRIYTRYLHGICICFYIYISTLLPHTTYFRLRQKRLFKLMNNYDDLWNNLKLSMGLVHLFASASVFASKPASIKVISG